MDQETTQVDEEHAARHIQLENPFHRPRHCWNYPELIQALVNAKCVPEGEEHMEFATQGGLNQLGKFHERKHFSETG